MTQSATQPHDTNPVAQQVAGLLADEPPSHVAPEDDDFADLASQVESLLASTPVETPLPPPSTPVHTPPLPAQAPAAATAEHEAPPVAGDLTSQVASLLDAGEHPPESLEAIDHDLAQLTETLLTDPTAANPAPDVPPVPHAAPVPTAVAPSAPSSAHADTPRSSPPIPVPAAPASTPTPDTASPAPPAVGTTLVPRLTRLLTPMGAFLGRPLASQPRGVRDSIGWLALWTLSCGVFVWVYTLFLHSPRLPQTPAGAPAITTPEAKEAKDHAADELEPPPSRSPQAH